MLWKGRLGPGLQITMDLQTGQIRKNVEVKSANAAKAPYGEWLRKHKIQIAPSDFGAEAAGELGNSTVQQMTAFGWSLEDLDMQVAGWSTPALRLTLTLSLTLSLSLTLTLGELAEAVAALSSEAGTEAEAREGGVTQLLERIATDAGGADAVAIDKETFVGSVTSREVAQFGTPGDEFQAAFGGMDKDGDGTISKEELVGSVTRFCSLMSATCDEEDEDEFPQRLAEAFDAFDTDQSGELDYEEFVMMVSSRSPVDSDSDQLASEVTE